ncbi:MAG TPA: GH25 family lysozyme [Kofleriaceae bacterium]|jgi:lysozyme
MRWVLLAALLAGCADPAPSSLEPIIRPTVCGSASTVNGIDVSEYDTSVDWPTAKAVGIDFAFMRVSDGIAYPDSSFAGFWSGARAAGVIRGAYQYFRPDVDPVQQADLLASSMGTLLPGDLPPVLDLEVADGVSTSGVVTAVNAWIAEVEAKTGRSPIIYAGLYSWPTLTGGADETQYPLWLAQYTTAACPDIPSPWTQWLFWQHSDTGAVDGVVSSQLDLDVFSGTLDQLETFAAGSGSAAPCGVIDASGGMIDDSDACFTPGGPSEYMRHVTDAGEDDTLYWTHTTEAAAQANYGEWDLYFAQAGTYHVEAYTDTTYATSQAADYQIVAAGQTQSSTIDQSAVDGWQSLGDIAFAAGGGQSITLGDNTGEATPKQLVFDAIRFTPVDSGSGSGSGSDTGSGNAPPVVHTGGGCATGSTSGRGTGGAVALVLAFVLRRRRCARSSSSL